MKYETARIHDRSAIGLLSIVAIELAREPRLNQAVVLVACGLSTTTAWQLWGAQPRAWRESRRGSSQ